MQNSALKLLPAAKLLPDWVELILFQEATTHHDAKQQAYHALIPIDINPKLRGRKSSFYYSIVMLIIKDHSILIAIYTSLEYTLKQISSLSSKCTETVKHIFRSPWI